MVKMVCSKVQVNSLFLSHPPSKENNNNSLVTCDSRLNTASNDINSGLFPLKGDGLQDDAEKEMFCWRARKYRNKLCATYGLLLKKKI